MDMRTDLTAVPHAGLGYQFLRIQVSKNHWGLGVFKRKWGPSLKSEGGDQGNMTTYAHICRCISTLPKDLNSQVRPARLKTRNASSD